MITNRSRSTRLSLACVGLVALVGFSACSDDPKPLTAQQQAALTGNTTAALPDSVTLPGGVTLPAGDDNGTVPDVADVSLPPGFAVPAGSSACLQYFQIISAAVSGAGNADSFASLGDGFAALSAQVPDDLKDDVATMSEGLTKLGALYAKYNYDFTKILSDPEAQTLFADQSFTAASTNVNTWLETECQTTGG